MKVMPSVDVIAHAIVAACRETGEEPTDLILHEFVQRADKWHHHFRARHYAYHALHNVFPKASQHQLCAALGVQNVPSFKASLSHGVRALWFSLEAVARVCQAVHAAQAAEEDAEEANMTPDQVERLRQMCGIM